MSQNLKIGIEAFGVKIGITASDNEKELIYSRLEEIFPNGYSEIDFSTCRHFFEIRKSAAGKFEFIKNGEFYESREAVEDAVGLMRTEIRYTFSEFAVERVFLHAGAVAFKNSGIIFPGQSLSGKSSIVADLIRRGAEYYSDDYAILDENALLYPHPKKISLRDSKDNRFRQTDYPVEHFQAVTGVCEIPVKLIIITEYEEGKIWQPEKLSNGEAVMQILPHTIPIRHNPAFTLRTLDRLVRGATVFSGMRGDLDEFIPKLMKLFNKVEF